MEQYRFAGYRIIEFPDESKSALKEVAHRLSPHEREIVDSWVRLQFTAWEPPGLGREQIAQLFGNLFRGMLGCMESGELERSVANLEEVGADLARRHFPYEALVISLHFLEESYMPFLLEPPTKNTRNWLIRLDEFLHVAFAAIATSYFQFHRNELLEEAEVGRIVQEGLFPVIPKRLGELDVGYVYVSARERARLGGDLLDLFSINDDEAAFIIGDLSGHGLEAAADSVMLRSLFKGFMHEKPDLPDAMARLNRVLMSELDGDHFATALAGTYESTGHLKLVNAGHPPPVLCGGVCRSIEHFDLPLAVGEVSTYSLTEVTMDPGTLFVAYTDGLIEARNHKGFFGEERVKEIAVSMHDAPARAIAEHLLDQASRYADGRVADDIAILVLKRVETKRAGSTSSLQEGQH